MVWKKISPLKPRTTLFGASLLVILGGGAFQSCGKVAIDRTMASSGLAAPVISLSDNFVKTTLNHAVSGTLGNGLPGAKFSLAQDQQLVELKLAHSTLRVDSANATFTYIPDNGFRGLETANVYSTLQNITNVLHVTFEVDNPVLDFKPALAVRAVECLSCHARIEGDLITDLGYKSAKDVGPDYFMGANPAGTAWISAYGAAHTGSPGLETATIVGRLAVPRVNLEKLDTGTVRAAFPTSLSDSIAAGFTTLAQYLGQYALPKNADFDGLVEKEEIYIGAATANEIRIAGGLSAQLTQHFYKNNAVDGDVTSLVHVKTGHFDYYTNSTSDPLTCEGDLFVDGTVLLDHLRLETTSGCRIYSTHSVFINGPVSYVNELALSNLEVASAVGIYMGFGYCVDCADSGAPFHYENQNSLKARWDNIRGDFAIPGYRSLGFEEAITAAQLDFAAISDLPAQPFPAVPDGEDAANFLYQYAQTQTNVLLWDASNSFVGESGTTYKHLLLNAPVVMSRYSGNFQGTVIAEFAMWRLSQFTFSFDPVFTGVALFPFLDYSKILSIK